MGHEYSYDSPGHGSVATLVALLCSVVCLAGCNVAVRTYHYDNQRTGWNSHETKLNYSNVNSSSLRKLKVVLDDPNDQIETQPLIVPHLHIAGGKHDVVYVATEYNNIYAIDANTGAKLFPKPVNFGKAVLTTRFAQQCSPQPVAATPTVGINGTPVIDVQTKTMYVIAYVNEGSESNPLPAYFLHALDLATLSHKVPPRLVRATYTDGTNTFTFDASHERQRPGLLLASGNVYAAFGSFCDDPDARGWILGWQAGSLTPLPQNELLNTRTTEPNGMFLASVWMSGYGLSADQNGDVYFSTGNSDKSSTHDQCTDVSQSVVKLRPDLTRGWKCPSNNNKGLNQFLFTPENIDVLEANDLDVGSGGVMVLPPQPGPYHNMVLANAKDGRMFLLNADDLGGLQPRDAGALDVETMGSGCWCGPTYFNDGSPHIVSSGGNFGPGYSQNSLGLWDLHTAPPKPNLALSASGNMPDTVLPQYPGFFTTVSSRGTRHAIIWAVSKPLYNNGAVGTPYVWLYAFKATPSGKTLPELVHAVAGTWKYYGFTNATIVPVVANGKVYVASDQELDIFGVGLRGGEKVESATAEFPKVPEHQVHGTVKKVEGTRFTIETRDHKMIEVDGSKASEFQYHVRAVGTRVVAAGTYDSNGVLQATVVWRARPSPASWPSDR